MAQPNTIGGAAMAAHRQHHSRRGVIRRGVGFLARACMRIPLFAYILAIYLALHVWVPDVRAVVVSISSFELAWVEVLYVLTLIVSMGELLRVSHPGVDNTMEVMLMGGIAAVYLVAFALGANDVEYALVFKTTEFLILAVASMVQFVVAIFVNSRTLKRTLDYSGGGEGW